MGREDVNPTAAVSRRKSFSVLPGRNHQVIGLVSKAYGCGGTVATFNHLMYYLNLY